QHLAPGVDDDRASEAVVIAWRAPDLVRGHHERLVLDRAGADQNLPVRLAGDLRERCRQRDDARALHREDPVELWEAQVVADGQPERGVSGRLRQDDVLARLLGLGLAVLLPGDHDIEHVDLAVDALDLTVGTDVHGRVRELVPPLAQLGDRAGHEVDAELARGRARPVDRAPALDRLRALAVVVVGAQDVELLGQNDQLRAVRRGRARQAVGGLEVAVLVFCGVELYSSGPHRCPLPLSGLTDESIQSLARPPRSTRRQTPYLR